MPVRVGGSAGRRVGLSPTLPLVATTPAEFLRLEMHAIATDGG